MQKISNLLVVAAALSLMACIEKPSATDTGDGDEQTGGEEEEDEETTGLDDDDDDDDDADEGHMFIPDTIAEPACDPWAQDCGEDEKCVPYSPSGGVWDSNKCVPVIGDGQVGDSCTYDGISSATDSCAVDSHCWDVMDVDGMNVGVCTPFCTGSADSPICGPETSCLIANEGSINLCIQTCDPLLQECSEGLACFWANNDFNCIFTTDEVTEGGACGYINDCAPGNFCASAQLLPECEGSDCCTAFCDLSDSICAVEGTECAAFFEEGNAAPGYEDVGVCIIPGA